MGITVDDAKDAINIRRHGISLRRAVDFDFDAALISIDDREDYDEVHFQAISFLDGRLYTLIFTDNGLDIRAISLRKATRWEANEYALG